MTIKFCGCKKALDLFVCTGRCVNSIEDYKNISKTERELDNIDANKIIKNRYGSN